jgi:hypothetical protein
VKKFYIVVILILSILLPAEALASGQWKLASVRRWPNRPNPKDLNVKIGQTLKSKGINFNYTYFDQNNTKKWLNSYVDFTWDFSTGVSVLKPGQKVLVYGKVTHNGSYLDHGNGGMLVGEAPRTESHGYRNDLTPHSWGYKTEWILNLTASNGTVKGQKEFTVPPGPNSDGSPLAILFVTYLGTTCGVEYIYHWSEDGGQASSYPLGKILSVIEVNRWKGTWKCRSDGKTYDAYWKNIQTGQEVRDVITLESLNDNNFTLYRQGNQGRYFGRLSENGTRISGGTASWYQQGWTWNAEISR